MAIVLASDKAIKRQLNLSGFQHPLNIEVTTTGIFLFLKGSKTKVYAPWASILAISQTGMNVPSGFYGYPIKLLEHLDNTMGTRRRRTRHPQY